MTSEQTAQLRSMTEQQAVKHYWDKYRKGELTREQYDQGIEYWKKLQTVSKRETIEQSNPNIPVERKKEEMELFMPTDTIARRSDKSMGETLAESFGGYIVPDTEEEHKAQWKKLLDLLLDMAWHDTGEITDKVYSVGHKGVCRISERVRDIEKHTEWKTESRHKSGPTWEYRIINPNKLI